MYEQLNCKINSKENSVIKRSDLLTYINIRTARE